MENLKTAVGLPHSRRRWSRGDRVCVPRHEVQVHTTSVRPDVREIMYWPGCGRRHGSGDDRVLQSR